MNKINTANLKLRPHHILSFARFVAKKKYLLPDEDYIKVFREKNGDLHCDEFILIWRDFLKSLYENKNFKFVYVEKSDSVCSSCDVRESCEKSDHETHKYFKELDFNAMKLFPVLKFGKSYDGNFLAKLFNEKKDVITL